MKWITILVLLITACGSVTEEIITIEEKNLIPEGIAVGDDGVIYLSNLYTKNIIATTNDGSNPTEVETKYSGQFSGVGITVKNGKIYALANNLGNNEVDGFNSILQVIDPVKKQLISSYEMRDSLPSFLNDLAVTDSGMVFITNTEKHKLHTIEGDSLAEFLMSKEIEYPNGIALSDNEKIIYVASFTKGIRSFDLASRAFLNTADTTGLTHGLDGLKFYKNSLIGIQNASRDRTKHAIIRFNLNGDGTAVVNADTLYVNHPSFNLPTTLDIRDGWVYCLSNSQMDNIDQETGELLRPDELTDTYVLKFKLE